MVLNASLSSLWEHQIPGKWRQKSYVCGSLLSNQIGFNFLLARVVVPRDGTPCYVWAEPSLGGTCFHRGVLSTQDIIRREQTIQHLSWQGWNSNVRDLFCFWQTPRWTWDQWISHSYSECCPQVPTLPKIASCQVQRLHRQTFLQLSGEPGFRRRKGTAVWKALHNIIRVGSAWACLTAICKLKHLTQKGIFVLPRFLCPWFAWCNYPKINMPWAELCKHKTMKNAANIFFLEVISESSPTYSPCSAPHLYSVFILPDTSWVVLCHLDCTHRHIQVYLQWIQNITASYFEGPSSSLLICKQEQDRFGHSHKNMWMEMFIFKCTWLFFFDKAVTRGSSLKSFFESMAASAAPTLLYSASWDSAEKRFGAHHAVSLCPTAPSGLLNRNSSFSQANLQTLCFFSAWGLILTRPFRHLHCLRPSFHIPLY